MSYIVKLINLLVHLSMTASIVSLTACGSGRNEKLTVDAIEKRNFPLQIIIHFKSSSDDLWEEGKGRINCKFTPKHNEIIYSYTGHAEKDGLHGYVVFLNAMRNYSSTSSEDERKIIDAIKKSKAIECDLFENNYFGKPKLNGSFTIPTKDIIKLK